MVQGQRNRIIYLIIECLYDIASALFTHQMHHVSWFVCKYIYYEVVNVTINECNNIALLILQDCVHLVVEDVQNTKNDLIHKSAENAEC